MFYLSLLQGRVAFGLQSAEKGEQGLRGMQGVFRHFIRKLTSKGNSRSCGSLLGGPSLRIPFHNTNCKGSSLFLPGFLRVAF